MRGDYHTNPMSAVKNIQIKKKTKVSMECVCTPRKQVHENNYKMYEHPLIPQKIVTVKRLKFIEGAFCNLSLLFSLFDVSIVHICS